VAEIFEDPSKTSLRERLGAALDSAGFDVDESRSPMPYPAGTTLPGPGIRADVSCTDSGGTKHLYFVRLNASKPLPGWLSTNVRLAFDLTGVEAHVAVTDNSAQIRAECAGLGVGLVLVKTDGSLERVLPYAPPDQTAATKQFQSEVKDARRRLETKVEMHLSRLQRNFDQIMTETAGMPDGIQAKYRMNVEKQAVGWEEWLTEISERLDAVGVSEDSAALADIRAEILAKEKP
jgi:hypothetical protein